MRRKLIVAGAAALALIAAFLGGRYSRTAKVVETVKVETRVEWRDREVTKRVEGPVREVERIVERPGAERVVTRWIERGPVTTDTAADASSSTSAQSSASKVTTPTRPDWRASVAAGWDPRALALKPEVYEGRLERRVLGTVWLGVWGRTDRTAGLAIGMEW